MRASAPTSSPANGRGSCSSSRTRTLAQDRVSELKGGHGLFTGDGREMIEELIQSVAVLEIVNQVAQRDTGTNEDRRTSEDPGVTVDNAARVLTHQTSVLAVTKSA